MNCVVIRKCPQVGRRSDRYENVRLEVPYGGVLVVCDQADGKPLHFYAPGEWSEVVREEVRSERTG